MKKLRAFKVFNFDWICRNYDFKTNKGSAIKSKHVLTGNLSLCNFGFHACKNISDCFSYYSFDPNNKVAEVELFGIVRASVVHMMDLKEKNEFAREVMKYNLSVQEIPLKEYRSQNNNWCKCKE